MQTSTASSVYSKTPSELPLPDRVGEVFCLLSSLKLKEVSTLEVSTLTRCPSLRDHGRSQEFSKGGSHWVKQYNHGVFATEYCRLFA